MGPDNSRGSDVSVRKTIRTRVQKLVAEENKKRCSPRLEKIPGSKRPYYGPSRNQQQPSDDTKIPASKRPYYGPSRNQQQPSNDSKIKKKSPTSCAFPLVATKLQQSLNMSGGCGNGVGGDNDGTGGGVGSDVGVGVGVGGVTSYVPHSKVDMAKVNDALKIYNKYYSQFSKEKEASKNDGNQLAKSPSSKKEGVGEADGQQSLSRPDLRAISMMLKRKEILYHEKRFGHLPGIDVNYQFGSRAEMVAIGLHGQWLNGIDYIGKSYGRKMKLKGYRFPIAVAIVLSGQYEDDQDNSENIEYTGQGGNDLKGSKHQIQDQKMAGGNLALKNCMEQSIPVRVIRGHTDGRDKTYTYDGLYKVSECWHAKGVSGFRVYKYSLKRLEGQPKLTSNQVHYNNGRSSWAPIKSPHLRLLDITEGQEEVNIPVMNAVDDTTITGFTYTKHNQVLSDLTLPPNATGCDCNGYCSDSKYCACAELNGGELPYVRIQGGRLIKPKDVVFECGPTCGCGPGCINRVSQRGLKYHLEIFRTSDRGWAVKTKDFIPCGAFVCEYIGELRRNSELNNVSENDYIFEIDCCHTMKGIDGREKRLGDVSVCVSKELENADENEPEFCVDAGRIGNVARFINHSCEPNLFVQCVLSTHRDPRFARIVLFASDNILPMEELTYDYGYALDSVVDIDGNVKTLPCHCGTSECRKRLY